MKLTKTNIAHSKDYYWLKMEEDPKSSRQNLDHKIGLGKSNLVGIRVTEENYVIREKNQQFLMGSNYWSVNQILLSDIHWNETVLMKKMSL